MRLHLDDVGFLEVSQLELVEDAVEEFLLLGFEVALRPVLEEVEEVDVPLGQAQILVAFARRRILHESELDQGGEVEEDGDGAEFERGEELGTPRSFSGVLDFRVVFGHGGILYLAAAADFFLRMSVALMNSSRSRSRILSVSPGSTLVRRSLIIR